MKASFLADRELFAEALSMTAAPDDAGSDEDFVERFLTGKQYHS